MKSKRLLILGAGRHQVPLIARANARGIETAVLDPSPSSPGKAIADFPVHGDALSVDDVINAAIELDVDGISSVGTDQVVLPWAIAAERIGLPCHIDPTAALAATNKVHMRSRLYSYGVPMPEELDSELTASFLMASKSVVVKPADSQGQRGVSRAWSFDEYRASYALAMSESRSGDVVVERFIEGPEVTINAWIDQEKVLALAVLDRITIVSSDGFGICLQHIAPSVSWSIETKPHQIAMRIAAAFGMKSGPIYAQCIVSGNEIYVIEAAARVGGGHEAQLLPRVLGFDPIDRSIDLALGQPSPVWISQPLGHGLINFVLARPGTFNTLSSFRELVEEGAVDEGSWYVGPKHTQKTVSNSLGRVGYFIVTGDTRATLLSRAQRTYQRLSITDTHGNELVYWPDDSSINLF